MVYSRDLLMDVLDLGVSVRNMPLVDVEGDIDIIAGKCQKKRLEQGK